MTTAIDLAPKRQVFLSAIFLSDLVLMAETTIKATSTRTVSIIRKVVFRNFRHGL
jgi:hypothetical protein